jgi:hypothetical protein
VYNVHVDKKCEQEGMKVGNDFGSTSLKQTRLSSRDLFFAFIRITMWDF